MGDSVLSIRVAAVVHIIPCKVVSLHSRPERTVHLVISLEVLGDYCSIVALVVEDLWSMSARGGSQGPLSFSTRPTSTGILLEDGSYVEKGKMKHLLRSLEILPSPLHIP